MTRPNTLARLLSVLIALSVILTCCVIGTSAFSFTQDVIIDGVDVSDQLEYNELLDKNGDPDFSKLDLTDKTLFPQGKKGAYLVTIGDTTKLVGNKSVKNWLGNWENWQNWTTSDEEMLEQYPELDEAWEEAYEAMGDSLSESDLSGIAEITSADMLKLFWNSFTGTTTAEQQTEISMIRVVKMKNNSKSKYKVKWLDKEGKTIAVDSYKMTGKVVNGLEGAQMYVFTADTLDDDCPFKYWVTMSPFEEDEEVAEQREEDHTPVASHFHFQYGSNLNCLLKYGQTYNNAENQNLRRRFWYPTMIDADASDTAKYNVILAMHGADLWEDESLEDDDDFYDDDDEGGWYDDDDDWDSGYYDDTDDWDDEDFDEEDFDDAWDEYLDDEEFDDEDWEDYLDEELDDAETSEDDRNSLAKTNEASPINVILGLSCATLVFFVGGIALHKEHDSESL